MKAFLKIDINRIIKSRLFWVSVFIGCIITVSQYFIYVYPSLKFLGDYSKEIIGTGYPHSWYEKWIGGELSTAQSYIYFMIVPLLAVMPYSSSVSEDKKHGYTALMFVRGSKITYYTSKLICSFLCSGCAVIIPLIINILLSCATLPSLHPDSSTGTSMIMSNCMWADLYFNNPNIYIFLYLLIIFAYSGLFGITSLAIGMITENNFLIYSSPFIINLFINALCSSLGGKWKNLCPFNFLTPAQRSVGNSFYIILAEFLICFGVIIFIYYYFARKDETLG